VHELRERHGVLERVRVVARRRGAQQCRRLVRLASASGDPRELTWSK
jgi:acetolactate synthase regulatory subunit